MKIITFLEGKKTYIISGLALCVIGSHLLGFIDIDTTAAILSALGFGGVATLRDAIAKSGKK